MPHLRMSFRGKEERILPASSNLLSSRSPCEADLFLGSKFRDLQDKLLVFVEISRWPASEKGLNFSRRHIVHDQGQHSEGLLISEADI